MIELEDSLIQIRNIINNKEAKLKDIENELIGLRRNEQEIIFEINKRNSIQYIKEFVLKHGNILDKNLHEELRTNLVKIFYKDSFYIDSYGLVLRLILDKLHVKHEYLDGLKGKNLKLKIELL